MRTNQWREDQRTQVRAAQIRFARWTSVLELVVITGLLSGCMFRRDERVTNQNGNVGVDYTRYAGLQIIGELAVESPRPAEPYRGPLELDLLEVTLLSACFDEIVTGGDPENPVSTICTADKLWGPLPDGVPLQSEFLCERDFCESELRRCLSFKNLELAESVGVFSFASQPFRSERIESAPQLRFEILEPETRGYMHRYRVPPIPAPAKTFAYLAAQEAMRQAGLAAASALTMTWEYAQTTQTCAGRLQQASLGAVPSPLDIGSGSDPAQPTAISQRLLPWPGVATA